jgi:hypothetical protein
MNELIRTEALLKEIIQERERAKKELEHQIEEITRLVTI